MTDYIPKVPPAYAIAQNNGQYFPRKRKKPQPPPGFKEILEEETSKLERMAKEDKKNE